jgi:hypothetical protein
MMKVTFGRITISIGSYAVIIGGMPGGLQL